MNPRIFILALRARWKAALAVFGGVLLATIVLSLIWPNKYTATASVVVDALPDPVNGTGTAAVAEAALDSYVMTQSQVIASERVAQQVVKRVKLDQDPEMQRRWLKKTDGVGDISIWIADDLLKHKLIIESGSAGAAAGHSSSIIEISVKWPDPVMAAKLANTFAQVAIETDIELKVEPSKQYARWFIERSRELHAELEVAQKKLSDYQKANGIVATDEKLDTETERLNELSTALVAIQGERQDSQSRQHQVGGDNESLPEVIQSPLIATLKNELSSAEAQQADVDARLGRNHPDTQAAAATVAALKQRIALETKKIATSLEGTAQVNVRRENDLRTALEAQKKRVLELKHQHDESSVLENDVTAVQAGLDAVNQRLAQSNLESQTLQTNMVLLTSATPPIEPSSPKLLLNTVLGIFMGMVLGAGWALLKEFRNPLVRDDEDLTEMLGLPVLVRISKIKPPATALGIQNPALGPSAI